MTTKCEEETVYYLSVSDWIQGKCDHAVWRRQCGTSVVVAGYEGIRTQCMRRQCGTSVVVTGYEGRVTCSMNPSPHLGLGTRCGGIWQRFTWGWSTPCPNAWSILDASVFQEMGVQLTQVGRGGPGDSRLGSALDLGEVTPTSHLTAL